MSNLFKSNSVNFTPLNIELILVTLLVSKLFIFTLFTVFFYEECHTSICVVTIDLKNKFLYNKSSNTETENPKRIVGESCGTNRKRIISVGGGLPVREENQKLLKFFYQILKYRADNNLSTIITSCSESPHIAKWLSNLFSFYEIFESTLS